MTFVKRIAGAAVLGTALLTGLSSAEAGYVVTLQQVGGDVVATGSGPIDLTDLIFAASGFVAAGIVPNLGIVGTGPASPTAEDSYLALAFTGPTNFGSGNSTDADSGSGDAVAINGQSGVLNVPSGYGSRNPLSDTATYSGQTFATLGVTPGTYVWSWGEGPNQNFTLNILATPVTVPEPASAKLLGAALAGLLLARTRRRNQSDA